LCLSWGVIHIPDQNLCRTNLPLISTTFDSLNEGDVFFEGDAAKFKEYGDDIELYPIKLNETREISHQKDSYPISLYERADPETKEKVLKVEFD